MVFTTGLLPNLNHIDLGNTGGGWGGFGIYVGWMAVVAAWWAATPFTLRHPRVVQRVGRALIDPIQGLFERLDPRPGEYDERDVAPYLWPNGRMPETAQCQQMSQNDFADYRLRPASPSGRACRCATSASS